MDSDASRLLELVRDALQPLVASRLNASGPEAARAFRGSVRDVHALLTFLTRNPASFPELNKKALNCAHEVLTDRNALAHQEAVDVRRLADTAAILLRALGAGQVVEVEDICRRLAAPSTPPAAVESATWPQVTVVACSKAKRRSAAPAAQLYDRSALFRLCVEQVKRDGNPWLIVSSKYGLVEPGRIIEPYEEDIKTWPSQRRAEWLLELFDQAGKLVAAHRIQAVRMLAGADYRAAVEDAFEGVGVECLTHPAWNRICREAFS